MSLSCCRRSKSSESVSQHEVVYSVSVGSFKALLAASSRQTTRCFASSDSSAVCQDMQLRRDLREDLNQQLLLDTEMDFLENANKIVKAAVEAAAARVKALHT